MVIFSACIQPIFCTKPRREDFSSRRAYNTAAFNDREGRRRVALLSTPEGFIKYINEYLKHKGSQKRYEDLSGLDFEAILGAMFGESFVGESFVGESFARESTFFKSDEERSAIRAFMFSYRKEAVITVVNDLKAFLSELGELFSKITLLTS